MSRPCSDHIGGYRLYYLGDPGSRDPLEVLHKGGTVPHGAVVLAVPYRHWDPMEWEQLVAVLTQLQHADSLEGRHEEFGEDTLELPAGAVVLAVDDHDDQERLQVALTSDQPGEASPGYTPLPADALLGLVRDQYRISGGLYAQYLNRAAASLGRACDEYDAWLAARAPLDDPDPFTGQLLWEEAAAACPGIGQLEHAIAEIGQLNVDYFDPARHVAEELYTQRARLQLAARHALPVAALEAPIWDPARPDAFETLMLPDAEGLAARPDWTGTATELHVLATKPYAYYNDEFWETAYPHQVLAVTTDADAVATATRRIALEAELHDELTRPGPATTDEPVFHPDELPPLPGWSSIPIVARGDAPSRFEHGCAYILSECRTLDAELGTVELAHLEAHPSLGAAQGALSQLLVAWSERCATPDQGRSSADADREFGSHGFEPSAIGYGPLGPALFARDTLRPAPYGPESRRLVITPVPLAPAD